MVITIPYKWTLSKIQNLAKKRRGRCLSTVYSNPRKKMLWECENGHVWEAVFDSIRRGSWCLQCRKNRPLTIEDIRETAEKRGGICLSEKYVNSSTKLKWQCSDEHIWYATPNNIRQGAWCPKCGAKKTNANKRLTIEMMNNLAKKRGGRCLSKEYMGIDTKLKWQCATGHIWQSTPYMVKAGYWCRICAGHPRLSLEDMKKIARERGGRCLSPQYINDSTKMKWQCARGDIWWATANNIKGGKWCAECASSRSERIARAYFEQIFGCKFPISYPKWLRVGNNKPMQLDGYNDSLKLAFEYQGRQHFEYSDLYHSKTSLQKIQKRDLLKKEICKNNGVFLIQIPWNLKWESLISYIRKCFKKERRKFPSISKNFKVDLSNAYSPEHLKYMHKLAMRQNGKCLSSEYFDARTPLKWQCSKGHVWETAPTNIQSGGWCPECAKVKRKTIDDAIKLAQSRHGKFLSKRFKSVHNKYWWQCSKGHIWRTTYSSISAGTWCRFCSKKKYLDIAEMQKIAKSHGGKCLSKRYINSNTPLTFQCGKGHIWKTKPQYITAGHWCHVCAGSRRGASQRLTIELMQRIAKKRGGKCLSKVYKNARTKLRWECAEGHVWQSVPYIVKKRSWCPICAVKNRTELKVCPK